MGAISFQVRYFVWVAPKLKKRDHDVRLQTTGNQGIWMKKWMVALSLACSSLADADSTATIRNIIINRVSHAINYEFSDATGVVYSGALMPEQIKTIYLNDHPNKLYGTYSLYTNECHWWNWFYWTCKSKFKTLFITKNEDAIWTNNEENIIIVEYGQNDMQ